MADSNAELDALSPGFGEGSEPLTLEDFTWLDETLAAVTKEGIGIELLHGYLTALAALPATPDCGEALEFVLRGPFAEQAPPEPEDPGKLTLPTRQLFHEVRRSLKEVTFDPRADLFFDPLEQPDPWVWCVGFTAALGKGDAWRQLDRDETLALFVGSIVAYTDPERALTGFSPAEADVMWNNLSALTPFLYRFWHADEASAGTAPQERPSLQTPDGDLFARATEALKAAASPHAITGEVLRARTNLWAERQPDTTGLGDLEPFDLVPQRQERLYGDAGPLSPEEYEAFSRDLDRYVGEGAGLDLLHGYLTALVVGPGELAYGAALNFVVRAEKPLHPPPEPEEFDRLLSLVGRLAQSIEREVRTGIFDPLISLYGTGPDRDFVPPPLLWAGGFLSAVFTRNSWKPIRKDPELGSFLGRLADYADPKRTDAVTSEDSQVIWDSIRLVAPLFYAFWAEEANKPQPLRTEPKVGRNAPCPCGSGKKYKHCCGKAA